MTRTLGITGTKLGRFLGSAAALLWLAVPVSAEPCGNGICDGTENFCNCPQGGIGSSTGDCAPEAGDGCCKRPSFVDDCLTEPACACPGGAACLDTGSMNSCLNCNDGVCDSGLGENYCACPQDCAPTCGDGCCIAPGENPFNCNLATGGDCLSLCGDKGCTEGEDSTSCPQDCPPGCGDGACGVAEDSCSCAVDCAPMCGDDCCDVRQGENCTTCTGDCPSRAQCGDGCCEGAETPCNCPNDCAPSPAADGCCAQTPGIVDCNNDPDCDCGAMDSCGLGGECGNCAGFFLECGPGKNYCLCPTYCSQACGDGCCTPGFDDAMSCPQDCMDLCGDDDCTGSETACSCGVDCAPTCGDGCCSFGENACACAAECSPAPMDGCCSPGEDRCDDLACPGSCCPNGSCEGGEDFTSCPADCRCGDGDCLDAGEEPCTCAADCPGICCTDGPCEASEGEHCGNCGGVGEDCECLPFQTCDTTPPPAVPACSTCGNGTCGFGETCSSCPEDCPCPAGETCLGAGACCGNGTCQMALGENCGSCPSDCVCPAGFTCQFGVCSALCPNGTCDPTENCTLCPSDCACTPPTLCVSGACVPPPDAGPPNDTGDEPSVDASEADVATAGPDGPAAEGGPLDGDGADGCSCRLASSAHARSPACAVLMLLLLGACRRRR